MDHLNFWRISTAYYQQKYISPRDLEKADSYVRLNRWIISEKFFIRDKDAKINFMGDFNEIKM